MIWQLHWWFSNKYFNVRSMLFYSVKAIGIHHQHHKAINMKFVRFTKIICVRNSWCIVRTLNALMHALNALMHALMMHHDARVDDASWCTRWWCIMMHALMHALIHALMHAWMRMRCSLRGCACDDDASWCTRWWCIMMHALMHALMHAWMRMRCSLREYACDAACVNAHAMQFAWFAKSAKSAKPSLLNPNDHCRFQMIMLVETWFKSANQLIINSGINSLDLADEIFCW